MVFLRFQASDDSLTHVLYVLHLYSSEVITVGRAQSGSTCISGYRNQAIQMPSDLSLGGLTVKTCGQRYSKIVRLSVKKN